MEKRRPISLKFIFFQYFFSVVLGCGIGLVMIGCLSLQGLKLGWYMPANYVENQVMDVKKQIEKDMPFDDSLIPPHCEYIFLSRERHIVKTNVKEGEIGAFYDGYRKFLQQKGSRIQYLLVERKDGQCLMRYHIESFYTVPWMEKYLPKLDHLIILLSLFTILALWIGLTYRYGSIVKRELDPLFKVAENISNKNLEFEISGSRIKEFSEVLSAMEEMRLELISALEKQWKIENARKDEIASLAHDIKTPLSVMRGNAEFLLTTDLNNKQLTYVEKILEKESQIEGYIKKLMEVNREETPVNMKFEKCSVVSFITRVRNAISECAVDEKFQVLYSEADVEGEVSIDQEKIFRALINIVSNAGRYCNHQPVMVHFLVSGKWFVIAVEDFGMGFSGEELKRAKEKFYKGDHARSDPNHYGMGLYIANQIAQNHGGCLILNNGAKGALVEFKLPLIKSTKSA